MFNEDVDVGLKADAPYAVDYVGPFLPEVRGDEGDVLKNYVVKGEVPGLYGGVHRQGDIPPEEAAQETKK